MSKFAIKLANKSSLSDAASPVDIIEAGITSDNRYITDTI